MKKYMNVGMWLLPSPQLDPERGRWGVKETKFQETQWLLNAHKPLAPPQLPNGPHETTMTLS